MQRSIEVNRRKFVILYETTSDDGCTCGTMKKICSHWQEDVRENFDLMVIYYLNITVAFKFSKLGVYNDNVLQATGRRLRTG